MATATKSPRKPNAAFMKPLTPSATLAAVIGAAPLPRTEVTKKIWEYIKNTTFKIQPIAAISMLTISCALYLKKSRSPCLN